MNEFEALKRIEDMLKTTEDAEDEEILANREAIIKAAAALKSVIGIKQRIDELLVKDETSMFEKMEFGILYSMHRNGEI